MGWLIIPMCLALSYEVLVRYVFSSPTVWAYDVTFMLYGTHFMLGAAYTLLTQGHIRTDFLYRFFSLRTRALIDAFFYGLFYFPGLLVFLWIGWKFTVQSWVLKERIVTSPWLPPVYPLKTVIPIALILLLIQGISELGKCIYTIIYNEEYPNTWGTGGYEEI
ncbi:hypothetical protein MHLNE_24970 [Moorella humiferrea]